MCLAIPVQIKEIIDENTAGKLKKSFLQTIFPMSKPFHQHVAIL